MQNETVIAISAAGAAVFVATVVSLARWKPIVITIGPPRRAQNPPAAPPPRLIEPPAAPEPPAPTPGIIPLPADLSPVDAPPPAPPGGYFTGASPTYLGLLR